MHFVWLSMLVGLGNIKKDRLNEYTSDHFAMACKNQWTKIGVRETNELITRFYMGEDEDV